MKPEEQQIREYKLYMAAFKGYDTTRIDIINHLITKFDYTDYLEIGVHGGQCIRNIYALRKDGVDPGAETRIPPEVNYPMTSDAFFEQIAADKKYDIIFIDGLHHDTQVYKDIKNAMLHLNEGGTIVCHDMSPNWEINQRKKPVPGVGAWNGDCWKAWVKLRTELTDWSMEVVNTDHGVGIIRAGYNKQLPFYGAEVNLDFEYLDANRKEALNLISEEDFFNKYSND